MTRRSIERRERRPRLLHYDPYGKPKGSVSLEGAPIGSYEPSSGVFTALTVTGDISVSGLVDGVDISNHAADVNAHHHTVVAGDTSIDVQAGQAVSVALAEVSGLDVDDGLQVADSIAGAGLTIASKILGLTTPGTLSVSSTNNAAGSHTHAITASSNPNGEVSALLKSDEYGGLTLEALQTHGAVTVDQGLTAAASAFRVIHHTHDYAHSHVVINPTAGWALDEQFGLDVDDSLLVRGYIVGKHALQIPGAVMICHYDGPAPFETNFTGNPTGHMGQVANTKDAQGNETGVIYRPGVFGKAVQVAEATTNRMPNPVCGGDLSGNWVGCASGTGATFERQTYAAYIDTYGIEWILGTGLSAIPGPYVIAYTGYAPTQGTTYTGQMRFRGRGSAIGKQVFFAVSERGGATGTESTTSANVELTGEWQWISVSHTVLRADRNDVSMFIRYTGAGEAGDTIWLDACQIEAKAYSTPLCFGGMGAGHSWSSTAHASASSRTLGVLSYANPLPTSGPFSIALWVIPSANLSGVSVGLWAAGTSTTATRCDAWHRATGSKPGWYSGPAGSWIQGGTAMLAHVPQHIVCTWDGTYRKLYVDGALVATSADESATPPYIDPTLWVGRSVTGSNFPGWVDDLLLVNRALDADEVRAIYESNAPVFAETSTWQWRAGRNLVWADADGLWAVDETGAAMFAVSGTTKSWGGASLGAGDVFVGNVAQNQYLHWDDSAGKLTVRGDVAVSGTVSVAWQDITNPPAGAGRLGTGTPGAKGLWLTGSHVGYYNGSSWPVDIGNDGTFYFSKDANNYVKYDGTTFEVKGKITIQAGSSGIASLSDAGALATKNAVDLATGEVLNKSADNIAEGTTRKWAAESGADITGSHTAYDTARVSGTAAATVKDGATRANAGLTVSGNVARLIRGSDLGAGSGAAVGLNMTSANLGYYNGSSWPVFISSKGYFQFQKDANNYFKWDGTTFEFKGRVVVTEGTTVDSLPDGTTYGKVNKTIISGGNIRVGTGTKDSDLKGWAIDSKEIVGQAGDGLDQVTLGTDGKIKAGGGNVSLGRAGLTLSTPSSYTGSAAIRYNSGDTTLGGLYTLHMTAGSLNMLYLVLSAQPNYMSQIEIQSNAPSSIQAATVLSAISGSTASKLTLYSDSDLAQYAEFNRLLKASGGLNVGSPSTGAGTGGIQVEKYIGVGINYTPGTGNVDASGYIRGQKGVVVGDGVTAPTAYEGIAFIYVDSADGDLKVKFGDGTTKTLATDT